MTGVLHIGDNLDSLARFVPPGSVDLVYLDPPFNSGRDYATQKRIGATEAGTVAFGDKFRWSKEAAETYRAIREGATPGLAAALAIVELAHPKSPLIAYLAFMAPRLVALHGVLRETGHLWLHCDDSANFALAIVLDGIFGIAPWNEKIFWNRGAHHNMGRNFGRTCDTLLHYPRRPYPIHRRNAPPRPPPIPNLWDDIAPLNMTAKERTGYPTQKPIALLKRIVALTSKPGDVVLDPFVGSGTTIAAAHELGRRWIGMDISPLAGEVVRARLGDAAFAGDRSAPARQLALSFPDERRVA